MPVPPLSIAVVGGSIAGCCAAVELAQAGHHVEVFERSASALVGQGAGIGLLPATLDLLIDHDCVDREIPRVAIREHVFAARTETHKRTGREALRLPMPTWSLNWADLHASLRKRLARETYHAGVEVRAITENTVRGATLQFDDGSARSFELVIFADGHASRGRRTVCPEVEPAYRGYVLWRGVLDARVLSDAAPLAETIYRFSAGELRGHAMMYRIPGGESTAADGGGLANFGCYVPVTLKELETLLVDRQGRRHTASLSAAEVRSEEQARFKALVQDVVPDYLGELMRLCHEMFVQAIFSVRAPRHCGGRMCLIGDAATLVSPVTGSGVLKAVNHVVDLTSKLSEYSDPDEALARWDRTQTAFGDGLFALSEQMEQALIWNMVDFAELSASETLAWWRATTSLPR